MRTTEFAPQTRMNPEIEHRYNFMMDTVRSLGHTAWQHINKGIEMELKPDGSKVTTADVALNERFMEMVDRQYPGDLVWGEERSNSTKNDLDAADQQWMWLIDPIDGTSGFWRSYQNKRFEDCTATTMITGFAPGATTPTMSVVHNLFYRPHQTISANPEGTFYTNKTLGNVPRIVRVRPGPTSLQDVDRFEHNSWPGSVPDISNVGRLIPAARRINHALFMGCVALGDADISAFPGPSHPHDVAPGALIVHNAGGSVMTMNGEGYEDIDWRAFPINGCIGANNDQLAKELVEKIAA